MVWGLIFCGCCRWVFSDAVDACLLLLVWGFCLLLCLQFSGIGVWGSQLCLPCNDTGIWGCTCFWSCRCLHPSGFLNPSPTMDFNMLIRSSTTKALGALFIACFFMGAAKLNGVQARDFDFFYLVQQWPGSYCDTKASCCYPTAGAPPVNFSIHGLWPNYNDGGYPSNCNSNNPFDPSQISDLREKLNKEWGSLACPSSNSLNFWEHEWEKHGTCSESVLNQHDYFAAALRLKESFDLLGALEQEEIQPDGREYSLSSIQTAVNSAGIECNTDESGNNQLYQIYSCVDSSASNFISCPVLPSSQCNSVIVFPRFPV